MHPCVTYTNARRLLALAPLAVGPLAVATRRAAPAVARHRAALREARAPGRVLSRRAARARAPAPPPAPAQAQAQAQARGLARVPRLRAAPAAQAPAPTPLLARAPRAVARARPATVSACGSHSLCGAACVPPSCKAGFRRRHRLSAPTCQPAGPPPACLPAASLPRTATYLANTPRTTPRHRHPCRRYGRRLCQRRRWPGDRRWHWRERERRGAR